VNSPGVRPVGQVRQVLITGIEGFVGGHLCRHLAGAGYRVIGLHWAEVTTPLPAELIQGDVCNFAGLKAVMEQTRPDAIVHLAGVTAVAISEAHPLATYQVNVLGTVNLLEAARQAVPNCRILVISSADVYGRANIGKPLSEETPPQPVSPYALSKLMASEAGRFYHRAFGMDVVILRPFSHTGPGQAATFVFPSVAQRIVEIERGKAEPVIEMGNIEVRRDYTDVRDIVRAYELALERCQKGETYNVTSGRPLMIKEGVEILCNLARVKVTITSTAAKRRERDIPLLTGDPTKFETATGWKPEIPIETTLADLLEYYRNR